MEFDKFDKVNAFLKTYEKGYVPAGKYQVQVKLDGANAGIIKIGSELRVHSRNNYLGTLTTEPSQHGGLSGFVEFVRENTEYFLRNLKDGDHVYGEWLIPHTITYPVEMYKKFYIFDDRYRGLVDEARGIRAAPVLGTIDIPSREYKDGQLIIDELLALGSKYQEGLGHKTEGLVLTRFNREDGYSKNTDRFKVILPEFLEEKGTPVVVNTDEPIERRMAAEFSIRSYEKIKEKVKDLKGVETLDHSHIGPVLGLAWNDYATEFLVDIVREYHWPVVRFKILKSEFDKRIRELLLSELNTGRLPAWAELAQVRE